MEALPEMGLGDLCVRMGLTYCAVKTGLAHQQCRARTHALIPSTRHVRIVHESRVN